MSLTPIFTGRVLTGGLLLLDRPKDYGRHLRSLAGKYVEVIARRRREQRSLDQNAYLHAVPVALLAEHCGYTVPEMKFELMGACWGWKTLPSGHQLPLKGHTAEMTVQECHEFIEWVIPWAVTTHGVQIPLPGEVE